jgi:nitroreductase
MLTTTAAAPTLPTMETMEAISRRRSIRRFKDTPVPRDLIEKVLATAVLAPSAKNRQPWRFVVLQGAARAKLARLMEEGADYLEAHGEKTWSTRHSAKVVAQAPVTVLIFNAAYEHEGLIFDHLIYSAPDIQSIGGMVQTLLLAAEDLGLGTLWICDILAAYPTIREWLGRKDELVTAVSLGYADEAPAARPRTPWQEVTTFREGE